VILKTAVTALLSSYCYGEIMKIFMFFMSLLVFSVMGQETRAQTTIVITKAECDRLVTQVASADVAYTPGVDVNGNAVAPAYLNPQPQISVPDTISIPVTIDLAANLGIPTSFLARPTVGEVQVSSDGRVTFNG
jgi:hypothetical protein